MKHSKVDNNYDKKLISELEKGAQYERYIETAFNNITDKERIPSTPDKIIEENRDIDPLLLQTNLATNNLKEIVPATSPALIKLIIEELKANDDLLDFNKYFKIFKKVTGTTKIRTIDQFKAYWNQFSEQELGEKLRIEPVTNITMGDVARSFDIAGLESMSNEDLDDIFKKTLEEANKTTIDKIITFKYVTAKNTLSNPITLTNKDGIISFEPLPRKTKGRNQIQANNDIKIRYILKHQNPMLKVNNLKVNWTGPPAMSSESSLMRETTGSGLLRSSTDLKKKLVHTLYH